MSLRYFFNAINIWDKNEFNSHEWIEQWIKLIATHVFKGNEITIFLNRILLNSIILYLASKDERQ